MKLYNELNLNKEDEVDGDTVDGLAKAACGLPPNGNGPSPSLLCYRARLRSDALLSTARSRDTQRGDSVSIQHYDVIRAHRYKYRRRGLIVRRHNVVSSCGLVTGPCGKLLVWPRSLTLHPANCVMHPLPTLWHTIASTVTWYVTCCREDCRSRKYAASCSCTTTWTPSLFATHDSVAAE
ncbi:hypothetical protein GWK47_005217 [Chionoecetes opilio]|uniref:Uncharacterized protein n=1 Tax=Chionoecetes opilio TaxID=41210 RepID=A0A8J5CX46_CHIOP|nr:hypothetical protein GWK47_005217 [Chionoecetes opilio]